MVLTDIISGVTQYTVGLVKDIISRIYDMSIHTIQITQSFVGWITDTFPFDDPKKTLLLAVVWLGLVIGVILMFSASSWSEGGVTTTDKEIGYSLDVGGVSGYGGESGDSGSGSNFSSSTLPAPPSILLLGDCISDLDCAKSYDESGNIRSLKCCSPEKYGNYSCGGRCVRFEDVGTDYCKHPGGCYIGVDANNEPLSWNNFVGDDMNRCDDKPEPNNYCQTRGSDTNNVNGLSKCCTDSLSPCYGYCTRGTGSNNCYDINACFEQNSPFVVVVEAGE